jgi:hypothetical protein
MLLSTLERLKSHTLENVFFGAKFELVWESEMEITKNQQL